MHHSGRFSPLSQQCETAMSVDRGSLLVLALALVWMVVSMVNLMLMVLRMSKLMSELVILMLTPDTIGVPFSAELHLFFIKGIIQLAWIMAWLFAPIASVRPRRQLHI